MSDAGKNVLKNPFAVKIRLNGQWEEFPGTGFSVTDLLLQKGIQPELVAVELNLSLIPRAAQTQTPLKDGDEVEVVRCIGGG